LDLRGGGRRYSSPQSACAMIDVRYWPLADMPVARSDVRFRR
jgi:hypothetical protein